MNGDDNTETGTVNRKRFNAAKFEKAKPGKGEVQHELATIAEASVFFRVSEKTIRRRLKAKELPGTMQGGRWRLPWAKLRELAGVN